MPKSSLPTLPRVEYHGELALHLGGVHGYKKVKKLRGGFQGASPNSKMYTGIKKDAKLAAIALAEKKFFKKNGREPRMLQEETALPLALPNCTTKVTRPKTIPSHCSPIFIARLTAAQPHPIANLLLPADPRNSLPESPKPLTPPGTVSDGFGRHRPLLAPIMPLSPYQAEWLLKHAGVQLVHAQVFP